MLISNPASCVKTYFIWQLVSNGDFFFKLVDAEIWTQVEIHLAILCGSVQTYRTLLKGFCPRCCRTPDDDCMTDLEPGCSLPRSPPQSLQDNAVQSADSARKRDDNWAHWEPSVSKVSKAYVRESVSRTLGLTRNDRVATLPAGVRPQFPSEYNVEERHLSPEMFADYRSRLHV